MMQAAVFDDRVCTLGEGPLWHPERDQLFWFDIVNRRMLSRTDAGPLEWQFEETVSAAGWIDRDRMLIASQSQLFVFDVETGVQDHIAPLEADNPVTRSNDGRADPFGGFWIGTMGHASERGAGSIYRYYRGQVEKLYGDITVTNSICFAPDGTTAYYADSMTRQIMRQALDQSGWPKGTPEVFLDLRDAKMIPDGAVVDSEGALWSAHWNASCIARYLPDGRLDQTIDAGGRLTSCPEFGGPELSTLFVTTARMGMKAPRPADGLTFVAETAFTGQRQHRVIL